eukprot:TCONS_00032297-protein
MADKKRRSSKSRQPVVPIPAVKPTYEVPKWAGKPPTGMHLDVLKEGKLIEKFIIDGKTHFFFGRQREFIDFTIDHTSCSRVHAVMVYHKHLERMFLVDLGSTHGTFMGSIKVEANKPMQLPLDESFHFGASTRTWSLREKPNIPNSALDMSLNTSTNTENNENDVSSVSLLGLPEAENELHDLTEFNTAHNRRISTLPIDEGNLNQSRKRKGCNVSFNNEEEVINPEDVDPSIGRFRNLVSTEIIIPHKKSRTASNSSDDNHNNDKTRDQSESHHDNDITSPTVKSFIPRITSAPEVEEPSLFAGIRNPVHVTAEERPAEQMERPSGPMKKKYEKEAWPGRKPKGQQNLLSV